MVHLRQQAFETVCWRKAFIYCIDSRVDFKEVHILWMLFICVVELFLNILYASVRENVFFVLYQGRVVSWMLF